MTTRRGKAKEQERRRQADSSKTEGMQVGHISGSTGIAIGHGAQSTVTQISHSTTDEIARFFTALQQKVSELPEGPDKGIAENAIQALEAEARKGEAASETYVQKWMRFLADTAPGAWEVAIDTFSNPVKGIGTVFKKIANKAKSAQSEKKFKA